jgi:hypothetical protein
MSPPRAEDGGHLIAGVEDSGHVAIDVLVPCHHHWKKILCRLARDLPLPVLAEDRGDPTKKLTQPLRSEVRHRTLLSIICLHPSMRSPWMVQD